MSQHTQPWSTTRVARVCHVTHATVCNWVKAGKLRAYRLPGGQYRVEPKYLLGFLRRYRIPVPDELHERRQAPLLFLGTREWFDPLAAALRAMGVSPVLEHTESLYAAGRRVGEIQPALLVIGPGLPVESTAEICRVNQPAGPSTLVIVSDHEPPQTRMMLLDHQCETLAESMPVEEVARHLCRMLSPDEPEDELNDEGGTT